MTQDAFVRAYRYLPRYDDTRPFYAWLAAIAIRLSSNWLKSRGRRTTHEVTLLEDTNPATDAADTTLSKLIASERSRTLWKHVAALPPRERAAVMLHYGDGLALHDVARALGVTTGTVKTLLFRARRHLRQRIVDALAPGDRHDR